ncbi:MAG: peroxiredoxin [Thermodesulfobacteriota bacterium]
MLKEGDRAPIFKLQGLDEKGKEREYSLTGFSGRKVVLYFYPKDNTPGCTTEACDFRDNLQKVVGKGAVVLGVSPDNIDSHKKFHAGHGVNFPLLSDRDRRVATVYGAYGQKKSFGKTALGIIRSTFIVDEKGFIKKAWYGVKVEGHVDEVLEALGG